MISDDLKSWTVSNLFILPLFKIGRQRLLELGLVNTFLYNGEDDVEYGDVLHLLFRPSDTEMLNDFLFAERSSKNSRIVDERDYPNNLVLVTFALPEKFKNDYKLIWEGKYSQTSSEYKNTIPAIVKYVDDKGYSMSNMTIQHMVFQKYKPLKSYWETEFNVTMDKDQELWTKPTIESETFKLKNYEPVTTDA